VKRILPILLLAAVALVAPLIARAATAPGVTTPSLDQVYSELVDLKTRVLKLETENRALKTQMAAMATHTHSMGSTSAGSGGLMTLRQMKYWLDHNECGDCSWQYRLGPSHSTEHFTGPPKL
jgi:hypothetical protein